ncbi:DEAD/DEAH box helicase [Acetobacter papayae]|uniref:DEAD/DEAH box helicase n=1 Tax=Acetobacter papayae TaxID=1076592 RepID=UPI0039E910E8
MVETVDAPPPAAAAKEAKPAKAAPSSRTKTRAKAVAPAKADTAVPELSAPVADDASPKTAGKTTPKAAPRRRKVSAAQTAKAENPAELTETVQEELAAPPAPKAKRATRSAATAGKTTTSTPRKKTTRAKKTEESAPVAVELLPESTQAPAATEASAPEPENPVAPSPAPAAGEEKITFADLGLSEPLLRAVTEMGYVHPTPIQAQAIPAVLMARDVLGVAQTGTGKTASFTLPMLEILSDSRARARMPRSLILEPTRELALQVAENFVNYGKHLKLNHALLIGGESMAEQKEVLNRGVDVLIATPGRLLDLFARGGLLLSHTKILVIDEADRMLDMGFIPDIEKIVGLLPPMRQTLFFSATMAPAIRKLADAFLHSPKEITVARPSSVATTITTGLLVVDEHDKRRTLRLLLRDPKLQNAIVFCNRKRDVDVLTKSLIKHGFSAGALHGDLPQSVRFSTLERFKSGDLKVLVCSDVAARGIDIGGLSHVFNFDLPFHAEDYVHRIGRTGRAGREGHAYSLACPYDRTLAEAIEELTKKPIPRMTVDGVTQLEWAEGKRPAGERDRGRKDKDKDRHREKDKPRDKEKNREKERDRPRNARPESAPDTRPEPQERPRHDSKPHGKQARHQRDEIAPVPGGETIGFGDLQPAFMQLPRRSSVRPNTPGIAAPEADTAQTPSRSDA